MAAGLVAEAMLLDVRMIMGSRYPRELADASALTTSTLLLEEMRAGGDVTADDVLFAIHATRGLARARELELDETLAVSFGRRWAS